MSRVTHSEPGLPMLKARSCGYAQVEDLVCAVVCRKELWLCASGTFRMRSGMPQGIVVMREWEDLGCAVNQSHVQQKVMKFDLDHVEQRRLL